MNCDDMDTLILPSEDGQEYVLAILYPFGWTVDQATERAIDAFKEAQRANPDEWGWEDYEPCLKRRGFVIPRWHRGPTWDKIREEKL